MALQIGAVAPDFEAETTEGKIKFHDWIGNSWALLFSHPKDFTPVCTTELGALAKLKPEFDKRGVKLMGLSVDPVDKHAKWSEDIKETQGAAPNYPMIGDTDFNVSKLYDMLPASTSGDPPTRTAADNQTVRNVFVIGPDKKIKLVLVYPMTTGRNFQEILRVDRFAADDGEASRRDACRLETGRGRHHRRLGVRRRGQDDLSAGLESAEALYPDRAAAEVALVAVIAGSAVTKRCRSGAHSLDALDIANPDSRAKGSSASRAKGSSARASFNRVSTSVRLRLWDRRESFTRAIPDESIAPSDADKSELPPWKKARPPDPYAPRC